MKEELKNLDQLLKETFTNEFRTGYANIKGVMMTDLYPKMVGSIENLKIWDDDVWVCSFPKSGTTWTQEMVWCISHDLDFKGAHIDLATRFPFLEEKPDAPSRSSARVDNAALVEKFPELENHEFVRDSVQFVENLPRPRFIKTHLPFQLLPRALREGGTQAKIVYVCRNPKDVCISFYHHTKHFAFQGNFEQFCSLFLGDKVPYCPFWDHILGFWNKRNDPSSNILFLKYEDMKSDLISVIQRTAEFLINTKLSSKKLNLLLHHLSFDSMKNNSAVNHNRMFDFTRQYLGALGETEFIRQGQVDQWRTVMAPDILGNFDDWMSKNLQSSDFSFESSLKPNDLFNDYISLSFEVYLIIGIQESHRVILKCRKTKMSEASEMGKNQDKASKNTDEKWEALLKSHLPSKLTTVNGVRLPEVFRKYAYKIENFKIRDDDIWVCTFPKAGTTWTQEMVWCLANDVDLEGAKTDLSDRFPFFELAAISDISKIPKELSESDPEIMRSIELCDDLPSPRFIKTHLPYHLLPRGLREGLTTAKIIYVRRNVKDNCISYYHHCKLMEGYRGDFNVFCQLFLADKLLYCPYWEHILGFWNRRRDPQLNILLLTFENMKSNISSVIHQTLEFLGKPPLSAEKLEILVDHLSFSNMKKNPAVNKEEWIEAMEKFNIFSIGNKFIRSGQINQWKGIMSRQLIEEFDQWTADNLVTSDIIP
ncbi:uncharacterized protein LOC135170796 [Diachasmimorpha longicaudata]|uniref:uncharacterized protein LOC135170796 n=1 Tax=Diachasmimorpha longicaudata TaxID=58733 RepID=UPI0030B90579